MIKKDIKIFFPYFDYEKNLLNKDFNYFFILRDLIPAGILIAEKRENYHYIHLDYVIPAYRDFKIAKFIFKENLEYLCNRGFKILRTHASYNLHSEYLKKIGFSKIDKDDLGDIYEKEISC